MFEAHSVAMHYDASRVLEKTSLTLRSGELTVLVGPNGAGKSTLLNILSGELPPASGYVTCHGDDIGLMKSSRLAEYRAVLPQFSSLSFPFTVLEVARLGLVDSAVTGGDVNLFVLDRLARVDLDDLSHRPYQALSGGEKQRVHLARVLVQMDSSRHGPDQQYVFLDEPVSSLDLRHQIQIMEIVRQRCRSGAGALAILHDLNLAALFADRIILMKAGCCVADGRPETVINLGTVMRVLDVDALVNRTPEPGRPFVLPQSDETYHEPGERLSNSRTF